MPQPLPLFDNMAHLEQSLPPKHIERPYVADDFALLKKFLLQYIGSQDTYNAYRRECERLAQWCWFVEDKSILLIKREDIENYIDFCQSPPKSWTGTSNVARFISRNGLRIANPKWRMFVTHRQQATYQFSEKALQALFIALSSFYNYCLQEGVMQHNPIAQLRQKSKYLRKQQDKRQIRRLSGVQWEFVMDTALKMAEHEPKQHERTLFIMSALYLMYLRVSELTVTARWAPKMGHFYQDSYENWWFKTVGKGNKARSIAVSDTMLAALKRYRAFRQLTPALPSPNEEAALIHKISGAGGVSSTRQIRLIVQSCFDASIARMRQEGFVDEASTLAVATAHWLRHTGISDDLNKRGRPLIHVRDDAGHTSSATTDIYNDTELQARHHSNKNKSVLPDG